MNNHRILPGAEPFFFPGGPVGCLLVHGFTGTPKEMRLLGEYLASQGYTVLGIRLAGHATRIEDMNHTKWEDWLTSVEDGINLLRSCTKELYVCGLSMGGILTLLSAARNQLDGAIALSTPFALPHDWKLNFIDFIKRIIPVVAKDEDEWHNPHLGEGHLSYAQYPTYGIAELAKLLSVTHHSLSNITCPVLLINSQDDKTVPTDHITQYYDLIPSETKEKIMIKDSGHIITCDSERRFVFDSINKFILNNSRCV